MRMVLTLAGVVHRFLLAQEFRLLIMALASAPVLWLIEHGVDHALFTDRHVLQDIRPELDRAAIAPIPDAVKPVLAERGFRVCESRPATSRIGYFVNNRIVRRFPKIHDRMRQFRCFDEDLGARLHDHIRRVGGGFYDYDGDYIRFSSTDESHPASNGRVYLLSIPWAPRTRTLVAVACQAPIALCAWVLVRKRMWPWFREGYRSDRVFRTAAASVLSTGVVLLVPAILTEAYLRWRIPFTDTERPVLFDPELGFLFPPNTRIRWTNRRDFWVEQTSNSLGFLDREPALPKPDGVFRVLVIGDSFVEAQQVHLAEKMHVLLEARLREALDTDMVDTVALGHSGTGQSNQLAWYDRYGADIDADFVVLLFHANDFTDNSALLQGVMNGWDPWRPPKLFHEPDESGATFARVGIDPDWVSHRVHQPHVLGRRGRDSRWQVIMDRYPETRAMFGDWSPSEFPDCIFYAHELPPVFSRALASTEHALRLFRERTEIRGEALLLVITHGVVANQYCADVVDGNGSRSRDMLNQLKRITEIAGRVGIPVLDLHRAFAERGDWQDTEFAHDNHWNALGHRWAAEAIADYLLEHRELLSPAARGERF